MEKKEQSCKCCCSCTNVLAWVAVILSACTLIGGAALGTCIYKKVSTLHKVIVETQYGSAENFEKVFNAYMTDEYRDQINKGVEEQIAQLAEQNAEADESDTTDVDTTDSSDSDLVNPTATTWGDEADEAYTLFNLSGTPGNVVINRESGMYKAVGGAYPQSSFEAAIAAVKDGSAKTDDMGQAGYLTEAQLAKVLDGAFFKDDNTNADIIIVEYSDLICPYCQRHYDARTLENIVEADSTVALVFKNMPLSFHETADLGAKGVKCAGEVGGTAAYYDFLDKAFDVAESDGKFSNDSLAGIAAELNLDADSFANCLNA